MKLFTLTKTLLLAVASTLMLVLVYLHTQGGVGSASLGARLSAVPGLSALGVSTPTSSPLNQGEDNEHDNDNDQTPSLSLREGFATKQSVSASSRSGLSDNDNTLSSVIPSYDPAFGSEAQARRESSLVQGSGSRVKPGMTPEGQMLGDSASVIPAYEPESRAWIPGQATVVRERRGQARNDKGGVVLGDSISLQPQPVNFSNSGLSEYQLNSIIAQQLTNLASIGLLGSGPRPASESASGAGSPSSSTYNSTTYNPTTPSVPPVISYIQPAPAQNFNGASLLSATDLSSTRFTTTTANITDTATIKTLSVTESATVGGDLTVTGTITGSVSGTINPSFTLGSIPFQGASGLTQDNANLFWDDTNNRLGIGTTSPAEKLEVKGNLKLSDTSSGSIIDTYYGGLYLGGTANDYSYGMEIIPSTTRVFGYQSILLSFTDGTTDYTSRSTYNKKDTFSFGTDAVFGLNVAGNNASSSVINFKKSRGTNAVPTVVSSGDVLGQIDFSGYNNAFRVGATIKGVADTGTGATGADMPGALLFLTSADGSATPTERMRVTSAGNVGIGTTSPTQKFDIYGGSAHTYGLVRGTQTTSDAAWSVSDGTNQWYTGLLSSVGASAGDYAFYKGGSIPVIIKSGGNVGIGTTAPGTLLDVQKAGTNQIFNFSTSSVGTGYLYGTMANTGGNLWIGVDRSSGGGLLSGSLAYAGIVGTQNATALQLGANGAMGITIAGSGTVTGTNVGIGTSAPGGKLHVYDATSAGLRVEGAAGYAYADFKNPDGSFYIGKERSSGGGVMTGSIANAGIIVTGNSQPIQFGTNDTARMIIAAGGNVGIGTTTPGATLHTTKQIATNNYVAHFENTETSDSNYSNVVDIVAGNNASLTYALRVRGSAGSTNLLHVQTNGNVGVGTTTPLAKLQINSANSTTNLRLVSANDNPYLLQAVNSTFSANPAYSYYLTNAGLFLEGTDQASDYSIYTNGFANRRFTITSGGNVGIGTTTPGAKLVVVGSSGTTLLNLHAASQPILKLSDDTSGSTSGDGFDLMQVGTDAYVINRENGPIKFYANNANAMSLFANGGLSVGSAYASTNGPVNGLIVSGNVGIGTTAPAEKLIVLGNAKFLGEGVDRGIVLDGYDGTSNQNYKTSLYSLSGAKGVLTFGSNGSNDIRAGDTAGGYLQFYVNNSSAPTTASSNGILALKLAADGVASFTGGNVGIGTASPSSLLHLNGPAGATTLGLTITNDTDGASIFFRKKSGVNNKLELGSANQDVGIFANNTERVTILAGSGNVGIGTTSPSTMLDVRGAADFLSSVRIGSSAHNTGSTYLVMSHSFPPSAGTPPQYSDKVALISQAAGDWGRTLGLHFAINNTADGSVVSTSDTKMFLSPAGNVGIGTTSPAEKLEVAGNIKIGSNLIYSADSGTSLNIATATWKSYNGNQSIVDSNGNTTIAVFSNTVATAPTLGSSGTVHVNNVQTQLITGGASGGAAGQSLLVQGGDASTAPQYAGGNGGNLVLQSGKQTDNTLGNEGTRGYIAFKTYTSGNTPTLTDRVRINADGNVGIGTTSPAFKLDIQGADGTDALAVRRTGGTVTHRLGNSGGDGAIQLYDGSAVEKIRFNSNGTNFLNGGNVGIGTTAPGRKLEVYSTTDGDGIKLNDGTVNSRFGIDVGNSAHWIGTVSSNPFYITTGGSSRIFIKADGNVGIGSLAPATKLDIGSADLGDGVAGPVITLGRNTNATNTGAGSINFQSKAGTAGYVWQDNAGNMRIHTAAPSNANDTAGVVVGDQTSTRETKTDIQDYTDIYAALNMVTSAPLHTFKYIKDVNGYGANSPLAKTRIGYIADEVPAAFMWGNSIDQVSVNGLLMASVKALNEQTTQLSVILANAGIQSNQGSGFSSSLSLRAEGRLGGRNDTGELPVISYNANSNYVIVAKQLYLSGDSVGQAKILAGSTSVRVTFSQPYEQQPIVTLTPNGKVGGEYWVGDKDATGFTIYVEEPMNGHATVSDITFDWHAFASLEARLTVSNGSTENIILVSRRGELQPPASTVAEDGQVNLAPTAEEGSETNAGEVAGAVDEAGEAATEEVPATIKDMDTAPESSAEPTSPPSDLST